MLFEGTQFSQLSRCVGDRDNKWRGSLNVYGADHGGHREAPPIGALLTKARLQRRHSLPSRSSGVVDELCETARSRVVGSTSRT